ncbi:hypothetical protein ADIS_1453 [Lunatimonas lonarensis]|uniref:Uncharacterized protein n=1 Tax=Lunatimonas lonarensis TaxID=1232681 RepID=R7ZV95_9BACT|nr:hypothetical protein [Lunatimonas lonarensis]EON78055.1 hypothetical protein ADIS_1453 [Lunatimonas lonarensis]
MFAGRGLGYLIHQGQQIPRWIFALEGQDTRKAYWLESAVAIKTPQGWKLKMLHSTRGKIE